MSQKLKLSTWGLKVQLILMLGVHEGHRTGTVRACSPAWTTPELGIPAAHDPPTSLVMCTCACVMNTVHCQRHRSMLGAHHINRVLQNHRLHLST